MTREQMIIALTDMVGEEEYSTLSTYLDLAGEAILNRCYPYADDGTELTVPRKYHALQIKIAATMLNKRGAESEIQHNENGINRIYGSADIPDDMLSEIVPFVGVIGS